MRTAQSLIIIIFSFVVVLLTINIYQNIRLKSQYIDGMVRRLGELELQELSTYFISLEEKLSLMRDLGRDIRLGKTDIKELNAKYIPFLENQANIEAIIIADTDGREYFLTRKDEGFLTRTAIPGKENTTFKYQAWTDSNVSGKSRSEGANYSPLSRPWFAGALKGGEIYWTGIYSYFHSNTRGVTASVGVGKGKGQGNIKNIFAIDISLGGIKQILAEHNAKRAGFLFLVTDAGSPIVDSRKENPGEAKSTAQLITTAVDEWMKQNRPFDEPVYFTAGDGKWVSLYQRIERKSGDFWLALAIPEVEMTEPLKETLFRVELTEILFASMGAIFTLLFMWKLGFFGLRPGKKITAQEKFFSTIAQGEGPEIEFKSTVRTNLKSGKTGKEIEFAWLKAVTAFLNSNGGVLLLGVSDSGEVTGVGVDGFESDDKCLLHIKNLINHHIGAEYSNFVTATALALDANLAVMIECRPAGAPVFLRIGKNEEFYIRSGPSSTKLSPSQMVDYLQSR